MEVPPIRKTPPGQEDNGGNDETDPETVNVYGKERTLLEPNVLEYFYELLSEGEENLEKRLEEKLQELRVSAEHSETSQKFMNRVELVVKSYRAGKRLGEQSTEEPSGKETRIIAQDEDSDSSLSEENFQISSEELSGDDTEPTEQVNNLVKYFKERCYQNEAHSSKERPGDETRCMDEVDNLDSSPSEENLQEQSSSDEPPVKRRRIFEDQVENIQISSTENSLERLSIEYASDKEEGESE